MSRASVRGGGLLVARAGVLRRGLLLLARVALLAGACRRRRPSSRPCASPGRSRSSRSRSPCSAPRPGTGPSRRGSHRRSRTPRPERRSSSGRARTCGRSGNGTRRSASGRQSTSEDAARSPMTQSSRSLPDTRALDRPRCAHSSLRTPALARGRRRSPRRRRRSSLHQLMAWPPHEDETLALFVGRDSPRGRRRARHARPRRRPAPLPLRLGRRASRPRARRPAARLGSVRGREPPARRAPRPSAGRPQGGADRDGARRGQLGLPLPRRLRAGCTASSSSSRCCRSCSCCARSIAARGGAGRSGAPRSCSPSHRTRTALSCSPPRACFVLARPPRPAPRRRWSRSRAVAVVGDPVLAHRPRARGPLRRRRRRPRRQARRPVGDRHVPVADGRRLQHRALARRSSSCSLLALVGLVTVRREARMLVALRDRRPRGGVPRRTLGGSTSPESRHLIFVAPVLRDPRRRRDRSVRPGGCRRPRSSLTAVLVILEVSWAWHRTPQLFEWEPNKRQATRAAGGGLPGGDEPARRPPVRLRAALPRRLGAQPRRSRDVVLPRADAVLALRTLERQPKPLGRGVWILDASERNNLKPRLEIENRDPGPPGLFETRVFGPFLVLRTREPVEDRGRLPDGSGARDARRPLARDRRRRRQPADDRARRPQPARLRPVAAPPLDTSR